MAYIFWNPNVVGGLADGSSWENAYTDLNVATSDAATVSGDVLVLAANAGLDNGSSTFIWTIPSKTALHSLVIISSEVLTGTAINYLPSTTPTIQATGTGGDVRLSTSKMNVVMYGVYLYAADDLDDFGIVDGSLKCYDCRFDYGMSESGAFSSRARSYTEFYNCTFNNNVNSNVGLVWLFEREYQYYKNCTINNADSSPSNTIFQIRDDSGIELDGCTFNGFKHSTICARSGSSSRSSYVKMYNCKTDILQVAFLKDNLGYDSDRYEFFGVSSANDPFNIYGKSSSFGHYQSDPSIYLDSAFGMKVITEGSALPWFSASKMKLVEVEADFSTPKTITVEFAQNGTTTELTNQEIWLEVSYPDDLATASFDVSNKSAGPFTGTITHPTSTANWVGISVTNARQSMSVTTTETGKEGFATVYVYLSKPSSTVYVEPVVTIS
jgi:hypothetical protein